MRSLPILCFFLCAANAAAAPTGTVVQPPKAATPAPKVAKASPKPVTDEDKAAAFVKKKQFDLACPIYEKLTKATPANTATWLELAQCELHRAHKKPAIDAAIHAAASEDRAVRKAAYEAMLAAGEKIDLPAKGCVWLPEDSAGVCDEQMWACGYEWTSPDQNGQTSGHAVTFGTESDERDVLETALRDGTALKPQLAAEWKALVALRLDELACGTCNASAVQSADGLVNARASGCFQQKTGRVQPPDICAQADADCEVLTTCMDEAATLARRVDLEHNRSLWPEASDIISAAHKVCDATCGVVGTTRCTAVSVNACSGLVGYTCVQTRRGKHPATRVGEISVGDGAKNWAEALAPAEKP